MKNIYPILVTFLFLSFSVLLHAQNQKNYHEGQLIIQLNPHINKSTAFAMQELEMDFKQISLKPIRQLSQRMQIWLYEFEPGKSTDASILEKVRAHRNISLAQFNHYMNLRETIPADEDFDEQWALKNAGQNGGVPDADIDATDAWDTNTGGISYFGDTIVIAIIDGGADIEHDDIAFWKNIHEIPQNDIDDDDNGYVDDYHGWNAYNHTGNVWADDHGTHVSGIAAAIGNNDRGVCGVNWHAKVLPISASSIQESTAVEGYAYALEQRATYNETGGVMGAFIVATNSSFGVDNGQPEDYPIWCAMFDSLGMQGVLSTGATANKNWDIDEKGDVPTACPSDFLLSVTNTNSSDQKNTFAGYGLTTIDLGAPGTQIYSTRNNNQYGNKSGTSMAAPHVAGAIAYLFSAADSAFIIDYMNNPEEYALKIKQYIMDGVDQIPTLNNKSVTGGRLNIFNSLNVLLDPPVFAVNPEDTLHAAVKPESLDSSYVFISNDGGSNVSWDLFVDNQPDWITFNKKNGNAGEGETDTLIVYFNTSGLENGEYNTLIKLVHNYVNEDSLAVNLIVSNTAIIENTNFPEISYFVAKPNPFRDQTQFEFMLKRDTRLEFEVFDVSGRSVFRITEKDYPKGKNTIGWSGLDMNGRKLNPGLYFIRLNQSGYEKVLKLLIR